MRPAARLLHRGWRRGAASPAPPSSPPRDMPQKPDIEKAERGAYAEQKKLAKLRVY